MTSIPAEFYALANAFLFALHNIFTKKALRYSNPATGVISSLLINIVFLWTMAFLLVPMADDHPGLGADFCRRRIFSTRADAFAHL